MTIAISIKVNDGIVLAADSASSMIIKNNDGSSGVINVYENGNKVANLHKDIPVGIITWGAGSIGVASTSTLIKDFRKLITEDPEHKIDPESYTVEEIAHKFFDFIYNDHYQQEFEAWESIQRPSLGFIIAGYSTGATLAEQWQIDILEGGFSHGPFISRDKEEVGATWSGAPEAISRLVLGYSENFPNVLLMSGVEPEQVGKIMRVASEVVQAPIFIPAMPIKDAIDIAHFLVDTTIKYVKYNPGPNTVGGPIEIAAITKHEGFKWITRKHYFNNDIN
ncbi:hypothetical protein [Paenibacillus medicaginis]|uniref:Uncharacterized protein n=1 Tax=Paenibacillus medicaginis TaxID=1470560 RepID=A0ABV5C0G7_9BACL